MIHTSQDQKPWAAVASPHLPHSSTSPPTPLYFSSSCLEQLFCFTCTNPGNLVIEYICPSCFGYKEARTQKVIQLKQIVMDMAFYNLAAPLIYSCFSFIQTLHYVSFLLTCIEKIASRLFFFGRMTLYIKTNQQNQ